jgi:hypothetical protein
MNEHGLTRIAAGFYVDAAGKLYLHMREFLAAHKLPDTQEAREQVRAEVRREFRQDDVPEVDF